ncbi:flagellar hook capping FlgD N-terminal domain-containing protein [Chengkuizengella sp. SCS-71B]|uniref:flagellar hook capping FlgD N-terminal domain-containing protein n=1 Tax=Chengkuizengella sp. SCS-71B TaxID=3115290 RepID=UPI0032C240FA
MSEYLPGVTNAWPYYSSSNQRISTSEEQNNLGQDQFLKLLMEQLKHQDPLSPTSDQDFIAQLAQFTSLEQLTKISDEIQLLRQSIGISSDMIGKEITYSYYDTDTSEMITETGIVEAISIISGRQYAIVEGEEVPLELIIKISDVTVSEEPEPEIPEEPEEPGALDAPASNEEEINIFEVNADLEVVNGVNEE